MASPRSRLVTWPYIHLCFSGRRFWRPHPDLDRAATPALPPGRGRPLFTVWFCLLAGAAAAPRPAMLAQGPSPRNPHGAPAEAPTELIAPAPRTPGIPT